MMLTINAISLAVAVTATAAVALVGVYAYLPYGVTAQQGKQAAYRTDGVAVLASEKE